jgi:LCP family protein required for cell wall assembly
MVTLMEKPTPHYKMRPHLGPERRASVDGFLRPNSGHTFSRRPAVKRSVAPLQKLVPPAPRPAQPAALSPEPSPLDFQQPSILHKTISAGEALPSRFGRSIEPNKKPAKHRSRKKLVLKLSLGAISLIVAVGAWLGWSVLGNINKVFHGNIISDAQALFSSAKLDGESQGRVNILLAGDSTDDPNHGGAQLTDSILLLSINTNTHQAFLLSIPRDLWVYIPGLGSHQKINSAHDVTNFHENGYPSGGMGQLEKIVKTDLGIPIDYYGLMDYGAFRDSVNAVGGVTIDIQSPDARGLFDPNANLKLPNGEVSLDGQQALNLARARGDGYGSYGFPSSDFARTEHQRQLFIAVSEKAKSLGVLANPLKISSLFNALGGNIQTDLNLQDVLRLIQLTKNINPSTVQSYTYPYTSGSGTGPLLTGYLDPATKEDALIPTAGLDDFSQLQQYYQDLISNSVPPQTAAPQQ